MFDNPFARQFEEPDDPEPPVGEIPEAQKILQGLLVDLPDEAQILVKKVNRELAKIQEQADEEIAKIREQAERQAGEVETKAQNRRKALLQHAVEQLEPLQKNLFRSGDLGKALATFVQIQALRARVLNVLPDPGNLLRYQQPGKTFYFRLTGSNEGPVWGSDIYTSDSHLATAAVHAGALELGEEAVVRVSVLDMTGVPVKGTLCNGVSTMDWGPYAVGYRVARA